MQPLESGDYQVSSPASMWSLSTGRVQGTSHRQTGVPCQDDALSWIDPQGTSLILALSDGAGSGRLTHYASAVAVRSALFYLKGAVLTGKTPDHGLMKEAFIQARTDVHRLYQQQRTAGGTASLRDFASTLVVILVHRETLLLAQIGDGAAVVETATELRCLSPADSREYVNETTFLVSQSALDTVYVHSEDATRITAIAVMTDGVQHLAIGYADNAPYAKFFRPIFSYALSHLEAPVIARNTELETFLDSDLVNAETDDDKTLVVGVRCI